MKSEETEHAMRNTMDRWRRHKAIWMSVISGTMLCLLSISIAKANHRGSAGYESSEVMGIEETIGHPIPGARFKVYWGKSNGLPGGETFSHAQVDDTVQTVIDALTVMATHRADYQRFDETLAKGVLHKVIIEPHVFNRDGKEFMFLVARTNREGQVNVLINAAALREQGFVNHPSKLVPILAREFQWVLSKSDTSPKRQVMAEERSLEHVPVLTRKEIDNLAGAEREKALKALFEGYLTTVDEYNSLELQPYYESGSASPVPAAQADSTTKFYDIRVRQALKRIVREPEFLQKTPKAVQSLLNGKIWNVAFTHIESRDWGTRTRVLPKEKAVQVGEKGRMIQPAKILINLHRKAVPEDPYYAMTDGLPMGALSTDQLAQVIALEIENQIIEKSMRGHVAEDERTAPQER
ncbi:MAG: hypothetical protein WD032_06330 [Nitrospirales bacterium]